VVHIHQPATGEGRVRPGGEKIEISIFAQLIRDVEITDPTSVTAFLLAIAKNMISEIR
jgi:hypothetical protein